MGEGLSELSHQPRLPLCPAPRPPLSRPRDGRPLPFRGCHTVGLDWDFSPLPPPDTSTLKHSQLSPDRKTCRWLFDVFSQDFSYLLSRGVACACAYTPHAHAQAPRHRVRNAYNKPTKLRSLHKITVPSNSHIYVYKYICTQVSHIHLYVER